MITHDRNLKSNGFHVKIILRKVNNGCGTTWITKKSKIYIEEREEKKIEMQPTP